MSHCRDNARSDVTIPYYLKDYRDTYEKAPRRAALRWFKDARFGLFTHYGVFSLLGRGGFVQHRDKIPVAEYARLKDRFTAERFDTDAIADLAVDAGMRYLTMTTRHHDSFCIFRTKETDFNSLDSPARRDLVEETAAACRKRGLGLCLYYSHGRDWRHPHAPNNDEWGGNARPFYETPEPAYAAGREHDLDRYVDFMHAQLTELLTQYGPVAVIWLDGWSVPANGPTETFRIPETYELIRRLQPQTLISYKWGFTGTEDFLAPEIQWLDPRSNNYNPIIEKKDRHVEICCSLTKSSYGYVAEEQGTHPGAEWVMQCIEVAKRHDANDHQKA